MSKKELATLKDTPPTLIKLKNQRLQYYRDELNRLKDIETQLINKHNNNNNLSERLKEVKRLAEQDRGQLDRALMELNLLKPLRTIIKYTIQCPNAKKEINILDCNRGIHLKLCGRTTCNEREKLYSDLKFVY